MNARKPRRLSALHLLTLALIGPALLLEALLPPGESWLPTDLTARVWVERALRTQRYTDERLGYLAGADHCGGARFITFARNEGSPLSDAWYDATQVMADAAMVQLGQRSRTCTLVKSVQFFDVVARPTPPGGYYPRADVTGRNVTTRDTYADDNAHIGLALLAARDAGGDAGWRAELLRRAESAAGFLIDGGLWDSTFGGGFWWNTNRGTMPEGKPSQTTALAALLFARLYEETGRQTYAEWAHACLTWLDDRLLDPASGLYRYGLRHWDMPAQGGEYLDPRLFNYDQGIMIEVHLLFERSLAPNTGHLERARALADRLQATFWEPELGGYPLEHQQSNVSASYSAWVTQSLLALYAADPDPTWLERARLNQETLERYLLDPAAGSYANMYFRCRGRDVEGCEHGARWSYDPTKYLSSQAWMQRAQALLAASLRVKDGG